ncbi:MAG TPA: hypothetical protein VMT35_08155 [Ignavibacteriaceae bacterium]|nr:hypothetical protein [Ignavibacteriaceae bacterium]
MKLIKLVGNSLIIAAFAASAGMLSGCGGVDEAQMAELNNLRSEVAALEQEANSLKEERGNLEKEMAEKNAQLQKCAQDKETTQSNLEKLPK